MNNQHAKVVHFSTVHPSNDTRVFHKECRSLSDAGYDVTLYARCAADATIDRVHVKRVNDYSGRLRRIVIGPLQLFRRLLDERAQIYHFHDPELLPMGILLRICGKRVIYDAHEWVRGDVGSKPYLPKPLARVLGSTAWALEQLASRLFAQVIAATPFIAGQFRADRVTVIHNYPDLAELGPGSQVPWSSREPIAAYVGGLNDERCGQELLAATDLLTDSAKLVIAGPLADGLDPSGRASVEYLGIIDRPGIAELLGRARCGVVLLRDLPNCRDAMPTKFFEYLASGLPVVVSSSTLPIAQLANELACGIVIDETDPAMIAAAIAKLVDDVDSSEAMGGRGQRAVLDELNWSKESSRLVQLYDRLLS